MPSAEDLLRQFLECLITAWVVKPARLGRVRAEEGEQLVLAFGSR